MLSGVRNIAHVVLTVVVLVAASAATWRLVRVDWGLDDQGDAGKGGRQVDILLARQRLVDRPLDGAAFRALGDRAAAEGNQAAAFGFYRTAVRREPRDPLVRTRLINIHLADGDAAAAVEHLDALLRIAPTVGNPLFERVLGMMDKVSWRDAVVNRLAVDPPWREMLPSALATTSDLASAEDVLAQLGAKSPLRPSEVALRASLLERLDRPFDARQAWARALPVSLRPLDALIFDGGFESGEGPEPYGWRFQSSGSAAVGLDRSHHIQGDSSLALEFDGRVIDLFGISQDLVLDPGLYRLDLQADLALAPAQRQFAWTVSCRSASMPTARLELPARTPAWKRFSVAFEVPSSCPTQRLELVHEGRNPAERRPSGRMAFDAIQLREVPR